MLAADTLFPLLCDKVLELLGMPTSGEVVYVEDDESSSDCTEVDADDYASRMADLLLLGAEQKARGSWQPATDSRKALGSALRLQGEAFVWLDTDEKILALSGGLPWRMGEDWPFSLESHTDLAVAGPGNPPAHQVCVEVEREGQPAGTFVLLFMSGGDEDTATTAPASAPGSDDLQEDVLPEGELVMTDAEFAESMQRESRVATAVSITVTVLIALLLALAISRLVTRRLSKLAATAGGPVGRGAELPGPFDDAGQDEIAVLARAMNTMRARANELVEDLADQDAKRREWVAQASHDLRTPLTALLACLDRAKLVLETTDPESARTVISEFLAVARMDADRVQALADDLFEIARLDAADPLTLEEVPPGELVQQAVKELSPVAEQKGVALTVDLPRALPILVADGRRLMRAMENLLRNAIQFARQRVEVLASVCDSGIRFEVRDDGAGLPEQGGEVKLAELRRRHSRDDSAGLGLVVARKVAEVHGGKLGAYNMETGGAAFWFVIPFPEESTGSGGN